MTYKLTNNELYVEVNSLGAGLTSLRDVHGTEYLWQGGPKYWKGQAPLLFPIVGALRNGRALIGGKECAMPRHGVARINTFKKTAEKADAITFTLESNDDTKKMYPFDFALSVSFELSGTTLIERFDVVNRGEVPMPFCLGCHPGFNIPLMAGEALSDYVLRFDRTETCDSPVIDPATDLILEGERRPVLDHTDTLPLCAALFEKDALVLEHIRSRGVSLYSLKTSRGIRMDFDGFNYFGIWQAKGAPFLCLEPWTGTATTDRESDVFEEKRGMTLLPPGESEELIMKITIL